MKHHCNRHFFIWPIGARMLVILSSAFVLLFYSQIFHTQSLLAQENPPTVTPDEVNAVARQLWCPLCSGVRLDTCELKACEQMREVIAIKLAEGEDEESITAYFLEQYGPQVLGEPPRQGFSWIAWILPVVAVAGGGVFFWRRLRQMARPATQTIGSRTGTPAQPPADNDTPESEIEQRLEQELARYD